MERFILAIRVQPGAGRSEVVGIHGDAVKIKIGAAPEKGKANAALVDFLAERLGLAKSQIEIVRGHTGRSKTVAIAGIDKNAAVRRLLDD